MLHSALVLAVPAAVLLFRRATDDYWTNLAVWLAALVLAGYASWPLSRTALASVSPGSSGRAAQEDWWVRDGFVRASVIFFITVSVGLLFLVIPGLMVLMIYSLYPFVIIERKAAGLQALTRSSELTGGNRIRLLRLLLISLLTLAPAVAALYVWGADPWGIIVAWVLGVPGLALTSANVAAAYRIIAYG